MKLHAHACVIHLFWEQEPRCLELLMMSPAKLVSPRKCLGPNVFRVWGMCFKHGQPVRSALWKWCSLIVVDWHKSTQLFIFFSWTPKLTQKCFYVQNEPQKTTSSWTHKCLRPDRPKNGFTSRWTIKCVHIHGPQSFGFPKSSCESYINMLQYLFVRLFFRGRLICERDHVDN